MNIHVWPTFILDGIEIDSKEEIEGGEREKKREGWRERRDIEREMERGREGGGGWEGWMREEKRELGGEKDEGERD